MDTAIIITAYNNPVALRRTLLGLVAQTDKNFRVVIADDGSDTTLTASWSDPRFDPLAISHIWQPHYGFGAASIRNRAIEHCDEKYLIFIDADCIPRDDFVAEHRARRRPKTFLSGHRLELPEPIQAKINDEDILSNRIFDPQFLGSQDPSLTKYRWRLSRSRWLARLRDLLGWRYCVFCSSNASAWKSDLLHVNGFDEGLTGYGSEDRDLGVRLTNSGVRPRYFKCSLSMLHQSHQRSYVDPARQQINRATFKRRRWDGTTRVPCGITKESDGHLK